jgi:hypothetical protein
VAVTFPRQEECDLAERVAGTESLGPLATVEKHIGLPCSMK